MRDHPRGLPILFLTEMWERFSFYGMRALLVLYLVDSMHFERDHALHIYATYTALVYLTPAIGGLIAERWLGTQRAIVSGGLIMAMGHFVMAFPSLLEVALGLLIIGNGLLKPNVTAILGTLYARNDPRRDGGFTLFYMGINLGAFVGPLVCGFLSKYYGWHFGFAVAGVGMVLGLGVFVWGHGRLGGTGRPPEATEGKDWRLSTRDLPLIGIIALCAPALVLGVLWIWPYISGIDTRVFASVALLIVGGLLFSIYREYPREEFDRVLAIVIVAVFVIMFWMGFEQAGGTMNLFAKDNTDRWMLGWEVPASWFQSINPLLILALAPLFSVFWLRLDSSQYALSSVAKQGIGMILLGLGFVVLAIAAARSEVVGLVSPLWLFSAFALHTMGELCLSPIGLSMVTRLAPARLTALMMGLWFSSFSVANYLAGTLEAMLKDSGIPLYWFLVGSSVGAGLVLLMLSPWIRRLMHGADK